jgi:hypothetical protein
MNPPAPPVSPPDEQSPKPVNPEPLQQQPDPEKRGSHPPAHTHVPQPWHDSEHPKTGTP